ncbi:hypothetical protein ANN_16395 [Periplaneta americana]|uniref:Uncharacterized protein n=1 Tax=Periplaneta americana TaxID=6978 RepID=A0ABQ8SK43_PERAM|nr:hypothetical protein ANN_16395 [Periplaneta americana]
MSPTCYTNISSRSVLQKERCCGTSRPYLQDPGINVVYYLPSGLRFRYRQHGYENRHFCRQITVTAKLSVPELFYDCHWTRSEYEGTPFTFEYRAEDLHHVEYRQYEIMLPLYKYTGTCQLRHTSLGHVTAFCYKLQWVVSAEYVPQNQ